MRRRHAFVLALCLPLAAQAAAPEDYVQGQMLSPETTSDGFKPLQEVTLPDSVYAGVRHADLSDLRVFNAEQVPVPHALCGSRASDPPLRDEMPLRLFPLKSAQARHEGTHVEVESSGRVDLSISAAGEPAANPPAVSGYVMDARPVQQDLQALRVDWASADGTSEMQVRVEASEDLDQWRSLVAPATLLHADAQGERIERVRITLPPARYAYLRLRRLDAGPQPLLNGVNAEILIEREPPPLRWITAQALASEQAAVFLFDAAHLAPMRSARIQLPGGNMSLRVALRSRAAVAAPWREVWSGEVFALEGAGARRSADIVFPPDSNRWWQIEVLHGADSLGQGALGLQLGYWPERLRFLAQGASPYLLAYGSERAGGGATRCDDLLRNIPPGELGAMIGVSVAGDGVPLGGEQALTPPVLPTTARKILLWMVLCGGVLLLGGMALSLLKRLREPGPPS